MKLRFFVLPLAFVLLSITVQAQTGLYLNPVAIRVSNSTPDSGPFSFLGNGATSNMFYGVSMGGYYDFHHTSTVGLGLDMRDSLTHGNDAMLNSFLLGVRITAKPLAKPFKFYVEPAIGAGSSRSPFSPRRLTKQQYSIFGGVDYPIQKHIDWRMVEVSYSSLTTINSSNFGYPLTAGASKLMGISTGLVFRIH
jgi:hypothetical protein